MIDEIGDEQQIPLVGHRVGQADTMPSFNAGTEYAGRARGEAPKAAAKP